MKTFRHKGKSPRMPQRFGVGAALLAAMAVTHAGAPTRISTDPAEPRANQAVRSDLHARILRRHVRTRSPAISRDRNHREQSSSCRFVHAEHLLSRSALSTNIPLAHRATGTRDISARVAWLQRSSWPTEFVPDRVGRSHRRASLRRAPSERHTGQRRFHSLQPGSASRFHRIVGNTKAIATEGSSPQCQPPSKSETPTRIRNAAKTRFSVVPLM